MTEAKQLLISWANNNSGWVKQLVKEILETRSALPEELLENIYTYFLKEKGLELGEVDVTENISEVEDTANLNETFFLKELSGVNNVNKLTPNQVVKFNQGVTVIFGENASGKSGYVRILKKLAATRSQEDVLPDVTLTSQVGLPQAAIFFHMGSKDSTLSWNGEGGVPPFNRMGIFDSRALISHVDADLTYVYTPRDLSYFKLTHTSIEGIRNKLDTERKSRKPTNNPFLNSFNKESKIYRLIETLGPTTDLRELEGFAKFGTEEEQLINPLKEQVEALNSQNVDSKLEQAEARKVILNQGVSLVRKVESFNWKKYGDLISSLNEAREKYALATEKAFLGDKTPGVLTESWKKFVEAGDELIGSIALKEYPSSGDACIYCRQPLEIAAIDLLKKYKAFCNDALKGEVKRIENDLTQLTPSLSYHDLEEYTRALQRKLANPQSQNRELLELKSKFAAEFKSVEAICQERKVVSPETLKSLANDVLLECNRLIAIADELTLTLKKQGDERKAALLQSLPKLKTLEDQRTLKSLLSEIKLYVENAKWSSKAETLSATFGSLLRSLTTQSKIASEDLLNKDFQSLFEQECKALKAPRVKLDFPGQKGEPARRKSLSPKHKLSDILSEGEQKVIALADFLAETSIRKVSSPLIFDDPVNSLDYKRIEHIADRLSKLSQTQQVIVFTHNILFATSLLSRFEQDTSRCTYYDVADSDGVPGFIRTGSHPRWDTVKNLRGKVNDMIQNAASKEGEVQQALIERTYDVFRSWCEVVVEQELLCNVAQRYTPHIAMTMLEKIKVDKLSPAINIILPIFKKCCRFMPGHSQPLETLAIRATIEELKEDWKSAQAALTQYHS